MMHLAKPSIPIDRLRDAFENKLQIDVLMSNYTTAHVGGVARGLLIVNSSHELASAVKKLWDMQVPFHIIGSGSNVLFSDRGTYEIIIINRARNSRIYMENQPPYVWAESGANLGTVARQVALKGLSGLEWAATVPGTVGGAVYGNAGAHGSDIQSNLILAEILHQGTETELWPVDRLDYGYRTSIFKKNLLPAVILSAQIRLAFDEPEKVQLRMKNFNEHRRATQPPGASMGSIFKNPAGNHAGRLIEEAGLKGVRIGGAQISTLHANFIINTEQATATDIYRLIHLARETVQKKFNINLDLEIELLGEWAEIP